MSEERLTAEQAAFSYLYPDAWARGKAELKAEGPDTTRLLHESMAKASGFIRQVMQAEAIPEPIRAVLQEALDALEEPGSEAKPMTIPETLAALEKGQARIETHMARSEGRMGEYLLTHTDPLAPVEDLNEKAVRKAMATVYSDVQAAHENITDAAIRHHIQAEIERAKRG